MTIERCMTSTDRVIDKAWSSIQVGDWVRWATPRFIMHGQVAKRAGNSMMIRDKDGGSRAVPDAKWYFVEGKRDPNADEHLVIIEPPVLPTPPYSYLKQQAVTVGQFISVAEACEAIRMDPKQMRRHIRRGVIPAEKRDDRWVIDRDALQTVAAKNGWL
jgi:hypothetical protein